MRSLVLVLAFPTWLLACGRRDHVAASPPARELPAAPASAAPAPGASVTAAGGVVEEKRCLDVERWDGAAAACAPACPAGEVYVPATGPEGFVMGKGFTSESHARVRVGKGHLLDTDRPHRVRLTRPFCMDALEVTAGEIQPCIDAGACKRPNPIRRFVTYPEKPDHPVNAIDWISARNFCQRAGKSLPTEAQWEWAATGGDGRAYPWGDEPPTCEHADFTPGVLPRPAADAGCHGGGPSRVGSHPAGDKVWPSGSIHDLAGNVWEWTLDNYRPYPDRDETDPDHLVSETGYHAVRGGGWNRSAVGIQAAFRGSSPHTYDVPGLGFRCVRNAR